MSPNDEDRKWIAEELAKVQTNLQTNLQTSLIELERSLMERTGGRIDAVEERLKEFVARSDHDLETKVITEFHKWGRTSDMRTRQAITDTGILGERMLAVEDRISALGREKHRA
jgi:hypothetical protein